MMDLISNLTPAPLGRLARVLYLRPALSFYLVLLMNSTSSWPLNLNKPSAASSSSSNQNQINEIRKPTLTTSASSSSSNNNTGILNNRQQHQQQQRESYLIDLLNEQQSDFISALRQFELSSKQPETIRATEESSKTRLEHGKWIPVSKSRQVLEQRASDSRDHTLTASKQLFPEAPASRQARSAPCDKIQSGRNQQVDQQQQQQQQQWAAASQSMNRVANTGNSTAAAAEGDGSDEDDDQEEDDKKQQPEALDGHESVALESSLPPPPPLPSQGQFDEPEDGAAASSNARSSSSNNINDPNDDDTDDQEAPAPDASSSDDAGVPADEAAARREQEAAEASEAEAADRSALAEQQAAQREIILAQAQSEAKAIREQQEALLKQQQLQQQILMRRHQSFLNDNDEEKKNDEKNSKAKIKSNAERRRQQHRNGSASSSSERGLAKGDRHLGPSGRYPQGEHRQAYDNNNNNNNIGDSYQHLRALGSTNKQHQLMQQQRHKEPLVQAGLGQPANRQHRKHLGGNQLMDDNQFSDQTENRIVDRGNLLAPGKGTESLSMPLALPETRAVSGLDNFSGDEEAESIISEDTIRLAQYHSHNDGTSLLNSPGSLALPEGALATTTTNNNNNLSIVGARLLNLTHSDNGGDLLAAAQHQHHSYGPHYGSLMGGFSDAGHYNTGGLSGDGGKGHYYQYAESHKKGQFESGFKRGNKKFSVSGQASQHKGHAEGHVKWYGKKGKGSHTWDYKHKNKKHYGSGGYGYGGGHHYY